MHKDEERQKYTLNALETDDWEVRFTKQVARSIAFHKDAIGISTEELARRCSEYRNEKGSVKTSTLNGLFAGKRKTIGVAEIFMFASALEVPVMSLLVPLGIADSVEVRPGQHLPAVRTVRTINGVDPWLGFTPNPLHMRFDNTPRPNRAGIAPERVMEQFQAENKLYEAMQGLMASLRDGDPYFLIDNRVQWVQEFLRSYGYYTKELESLGISAPPLAPMFSWLSRLKPEEFTRKLAEDFAPQFEKERARFLALEASDVPPA